MKMIYFKGDHPNFGDELNTWLWPKLLPDFFDEDEETVFLGIGTILGMDLPKNAKRKILFGSGFSYQYFPKPDVHNEDWDVFFVRGPRTAEALGLTPEYSLGDGAILLRETYKAEKTNEFVSFMPHWESLAKGQWEKTCELAGINLIDPRNSDVEAVLAQMCKSKLIITEAMHGAIVADALRIPWIPVLPLWKSHRSKWYDWAESLDIELKSSRMPPTSIGEAKLSFLRKPLVNSPLAKPTENMLPHVAAIRLKQIAKKKPFLSEDKVIERVTAQMMEKIHLVKEKYGK